MTDQFTNAENTIRASIGFVLAFFPAFLTALPFMIQIVAGCTGLYLLRISIRAKHLEKKKLEMEIDKLNKQL